MLITLILKGITKMNKKRRGPYMTITPQKEIEICENCPYPSPRCGEFGCSYFRTKKRKLKNKESEK